MISVEIIGNYNLVCSELDETNYEIELFLDWKKFKKFEFKNKNRDEVMNAYNEIKSSLKQAICKD